MSEIFAFFIPWHETCKYTAKHYYRFRGNESYFLQGVYYGKHSTTRCHPAPYRRKGPVIQGGNHPGEINFPEQYKGSWVILFSHPADFTPVCTSDS